MLILPNSPSIRESILSGEYEYDGANDWPLFLYADFKADPKALSNRVFESELLFQVRFPLMIESGLLSIIESARFGGAFFSVRARPTRGMEQIVPVVGPMQLSTT